MARPQLSPRLAAIASLIPGGSRVVDVGSGHGRLAAWLARSGHALATIATERTPALVRELEPLARESGFELRLGDGLQALEASDAAEVIVLAGLGFRSIRGILEREFAQTRNARRLVLQPQTESGLLRRWLVEQAFEIVDERLVPERGRSYVVIAAESRSGVRRPTHPRLDDDDLLEAGPCLILSQPTEVRREWEATERRLERILSRAAAGADRERAANGLALARRLLAALGGDETAGG